MSLVYQAIPASCKELQFRYSNSGKFVSPSRARQTLSWKFFRPLANGAMSGAMFETFVISEILKSYSNRGIGYRYCVSYYRGKDKKESAQTAPQ